jgi:hypothetical protein
MNEVVKTRENLTGVMGHLDRDIKLGKKGSCIAHMFQLSMDVATYIRLYRDQIKDEICVIYQGLVNGLGAVLSMNSEIDAQDEYMLGETLELIEQSLKDEGLGKLLQQFQGILRDNNMVASLSSPNKLEI